MEDQKIVVKAPGKILWIGGYSVLERPNISFVTTVDAHVNAEITKNTDFSVKFNSPQFNLSASCTVDRSTGKITGEIAPELKLFKTAAEVAASYVAGLGIKLNGFNITATNDEQFSYNISSGKVAKSGLGSSAAVTVATVGSVLKAFDFDITNLDLVHKLSQIAHSLATGKVGSGFDIAASTYGSILYTRYSPEILSAFPADYTVDQLIGVVKRTWDCVITKSPLLGDFNLAFATFVGQSMSTVKAIGSVSDFKKNSPDAYSRIIRDINDENVRALEALQRINMGEVDNMGSFRNAFEKGRMLTKRLGEMSNVSVEPDDCTTLIDQSKRNGAFVAKLPGAGGKDAIAALTTGTNDNRRLKEFWSLNKELSVMDLRIDNNGVA